MRVSKECNSLLRAGYDVHFVGWGEANQGDRPDPMPEVPKHIFASRTNGSAIAKALRLPAFAVYVAQVVHTIRPDFAHAVNEEIGFLVLLLQRIYGFKSICDIFDSVEMVWGQKVFPVASAAKFVARFVHRWSDALIVTDDMRKLRLGEYAAKARTVGNYPEDVGSDVALELPCIDSHIRLYVAGSLSSGRGLESVLQLVESRRDIEVVSAGWVYDETGKRFIDHPRVNYVGVITPAESLLLAARCHAILALYEPISENNVLASPNKIFDALCIGRPVVINREARVSQWVLENDLGYVVPYGDVAELSAVVDHLQDRRGEWNEVAKRLRSLFEDGFSWGVAEKELLAVYEEV